MCEWLWGFIPYPDWVVSASIDVYSYTGLDIDINITTDDAVTEVTDYVDMIKGLLEEGGDESDAETLASRYQQMLQNDSEWAELFKYRIMHQKKSLAKIVNFSMEISFVVSANVNVYVGVDFWYEIGRRYSFTMQLLNSQTSNNTVSLMPEEYELEVYVMGMLGLRAGLRIDLAASLIHKKVAGVGISAEAGAYIELYGYFFYKLHYLEGSEGNADKRESQAGGNLYVEVGIYVEVGAEVEALGGLITWMPTIYSQTWPLWTAGNQYSILGFHEPAGGIGTLEFGYTDIYSVPSTVFTMDVLDMKTGKVSQTNYANIAYGNNFTIENTNSEIKDGWRNKIGLGFLVIPAVEWTYVLTAAHPVDEMERYEEGQLIITYSDPTSKLAFNTEPLQRVVDYKYDQVGDQGKHFVLNSEAKPWQMSFYDFPGAAISYDVSKFDRYGYTRLGWLDMNGSYTSESDAMNSLVQDSELPTSIPMNKSLYYLAVWEKVPVSYKVRQHYQNVDGSYPTNSDAEITTHEDGWVEEIVTPGEEGHFTDAVQEREGFGEPFTRSITVVKGEGTIADFYYPRESYTATFNYVVNGETVKTVTNRLKYEQPLNVPEPSLDGYTTSGWENLDSTMPAQDKTYTATFTPNSNTPYVVEHYLQQDDGSYVLNTREELSGTTGQTANVTLKDFSEQGYSEGQYAALTIAGDGSTVVKVRYDQTALYTATFYAEDETGAKVVIGKSYYYEGKTISVPQSVYNYKPGYVPVWETGTSFTGTDKDTEIWVSDWLEGEGTPYKVEHWVQNADDPDEYELVQTDNKTGTTNGPVDVTLMEYNENELMPGEYEEGLTIAGDGTTVVEVKYDRCEYTLTYDLNAGDNTTAQFVPGVEGKVEMRFGQTITLLTSADVQREGHALTGWTTDAAGANRFTGTTMPAENLTLYAVWKEGIPYTVVSEFETVKFDDFRWYYVWGQSPEEGEPSLYYNYHYDEVESTTGIADKGSTTIQVEAEPRKGFVTPEPKTLDLTGDDPTVEFDYVRKTYEFTVCDVSEGVTEELYTVSGVRCGTDLTKVQLKFGYLPKALYTDEACTQPYDPYYEGEETIALYVEEWEGVEYYLEVRFGSYHIADDYSEWWAALEEEGVRLDDVDTNSNSRRLYIKYGENIAMPDETDVKIPISVRYKDYSGADANYVIRLIPGQAFDDVYSGSPWVNNDGLDNWLFRERGGEPGEDGAAQKIYTAGDFFDMEQDVELGIVNFELANDIDFSGVPEWSTLRTYDIDESTKPITLDGMGYTLSGFTHTRGQGLFSVLPSGSMIYDLEIDGFKISGDQYELDGYTTGLGLLVCDVLASTEGGSYSPGGITLRNITVTNSSIKYGEERYVGGLIGWCDYATLENCKIDSTVTLTNTGNVPGIGAFIGKADQTKVNVSIDEDCVNGIEGLPKVASPEIA